MTMPPTAPQSMTRALRHDQSHVCKGYRRLMHNGDRDLPLLRAPIPQHLLRGVAARWTTDRFVMAGPPKAVERAFQKQRRKKPLTSRRADTREPARVCPTARLHSGGGTCD